MYCEEYEKNSVMYMKKMFSYANEKTKTDAGAADPLLILLNAITARDYEIIKYMKYIIPDLNLRYKKDILFFRAYIDKNVQFIEWLLTMCPDMNNNLVITNTYESLKKRIQTTI